ncbi:MAG: T9SS type A sorting domain-containing protein [Bacteroidetes bacterium]|nr:T9SS type A sorting domain-containing protein [Bacteroidota bacterium]
MKKLLLSISFFATVALNAQYTITSSSNPVVGDVDASVQTNTVGLSQPSSGVNQVWNYANITNSTAVTSATYVAMNTVPNASLFSGATIASTSDGVNFDVSQITSTQINYLGTAVATPTDCQVWSNPATIMQTPFSMNSFYTDAFAFSNSSYTLNGSITQTGTGTGTLNLPGSTHNNVLKVTNVFTYTLTAPGFVVTLKSNQQQFYGSSSKFSLFGINSQTTTQNGVPSTDVNAYMNAAFAVGIEESSLNTSFNVFPNPVTSGNVTIRFTNESSKSISLTLVSVLGQVVKETTFENPVYGDNNFSMDLKKVTPGIYYLKIKSGSTESVKKLVVE